MLYSIVWDERRSQEFSGTYGMFQNGRSEQTGEVLVQRRERELSCSSRDFVQNGQFHRHTHITNLASGLVLRRQIVNDISDYWTWTIRKIPILCTHASFHAHVTNTPGSPKSFTRLPSPFYKRSHMPSRFLSSYFAHFHFVTLMT
jgi:hypothetical protein